MLIVTLPMSRYQFAWPTFRQTVEALWKSLDASWRCFGSVVVDNKSAAIVRADAKDPGINPSVSEYAQVVDLSSIRGASGTRKTKRLPREYTYLTLKASGGRHDHRCMPR